MSKANGLDGKAINKPDAVFSKGISPGLLYPGNAVFQEPYCLYFDLFLLEPCG